MAINELLKSLNHHSKRGNLALTSIKTSTASTSSVVNKLGIKIESRDERFQVSYKFHLKSTHGNRFLIL